MSDFIIFYRKQGASERNLHYAQLDHSTKKHAKLHWNWTTRSCNSRVYRQTDRQTYRQTDNNGTCSDQISMRLFLVQRKYPTII